VEDCIQATVAFLEMDQQTFIKQGGRILGLSIEKPFLMSYPVQSEITSDTVVTDVIGYRSGQSYVAKNK
jgi:hypothetical protein